MNFQSLEERRGEFLSVHHPQTTAGSHQGPNVGHASTSLCINGIHAGLHKIKLEKERAQAAVSESQNAGFIAAFDPEFQHAAVRTVVDAAVTSCRVPECYENVGEAVKGMRVATEKGPLKCVWWPFSGF